MNIRVMKSIFECKMPTFINLFSKIHRAAHQHKISFLGTWLKGAALLPPRPSMLAL